MDEALALNLWCVLPLHLGLPVFLLIFPSSKSGSKCWTNVTGKAGKIVWNGCLKKEYSLTWSYWLQSVLLIPVGNWLGHQGPWLPSTSLAPCLSWSRTLHLYRLRMPSTSPPQRCRRRVTAWGHSLDPTPKKLFHMIKMVCKNRLPSQLDQAAARKEGFQCQQPLRLEESASVSHVNSHVNGPVASPFSPDILELNWGFSGKIIELNGGFSSKRCLNTRW